VLAFYKLREDGRCRFDELWQAMEQAGNQKDALDKLQSIMVGIFSVVISIVYLYDRENEKLELLKFIGQVEYRIHNLAFYIDTAAKGIKLPKELLASLTGIAISTVRGMISTRTYGKFQGEFYIPILNPQKVVQDYFSLPDVKALH
jgi:hypothetical protein